jgi:hypothetical protein
LFPLGFAVYIYVQLLVISSTPSSDYIFLCAGKYATI